MLIFAPIVTASSDAKEEKPSAGTLCRSHGPSHTLLLEEQHYQKLEKFASHDLVVISGDKSRPRIFHQ